MRRALITGITGQDGSYLSELLLDKSYEVYGLVKESDFENKVALDNILHLSEKLTLFPCDISDYKKVESLVKKILPTECYHLAAQSIVNPSPEKSQYTLHTNISGTHNILNALAKFAPKCRFYFAGSSEMFGDTTESPQSESTPFYPRNFYGLSKFAGFNLTKIYRRDFGLFACCGILFNHESPRRGKEFVTRKISSAVARIHSGSKERLKLGDLSARRDWGYAPDYVKAMWLMLQHETPDDYVVSTGITHSVKEFVGEAFKHVGLNWEDHVEIDKNLFRKPETVVLCGNSEKAKMTLGWSPSVDFKSLVHQMVDSEMKNASSLFPK